MIQSNRLGKCKPGEAAGLNPRLIKQRPQTPLKSVQSCRDAVVRSANNHLMRGERAKASSVRL